MSMTILQRASVVGPGACRTLFGAGLLTPPSDGPQVSRRGRGWRPPVGEVARSGDLTTT